MKLVVKAMRPAERGETPHQGAAGVCLRQRGEIGGDRRGGGRQRRPARGATPGAEMLPIGPVGAQGRGCQRLAGEVDGGGEGRQCFRRDRTGPGQRETSAARRIADGRDCAGGDGGIRGRKNGIGHRRRWNPLAALDFGGE